MNRALRMNRAYPPCQLTKKNINSVQCCVLQRITIGFISSTLFVRFRHVVLLLVHEKHIPHNTS